MNQKARLDKLETPNDFQKVTEFWNHFSLSELEAMERGEVDAHTMAKFNRLNGWRIMELSMLVMSPEERAEYEIELERIQNE